MPDNDDARLARLEKKVDWIIRLVAVQLAVTCLLGLSYGISYIFNIASTIVVLLVVAIPLLYVFRHSLPGAARRTGRRVVKTVTSFIGRKSASLFQKHSG